jgi:hypothetical protein
MAVIEEIKEEEIFVCHKCLIQMKNEETAMRLKEKEEDEECRISYCEKCVSEDAELKEKQTYMMRMMVSQALLGCDKATQEEIKQELMKEQPKQYELIKDLFGLDRKVEYLDEDKNVIRTVIE